MERVDRRASAQLVQRLDAFRCAEMLRKPGVKNAARHKQCPEIKAGKACNDEDAAGEKKGPPRCESVMLEFDKADPAVETVSDLTTQTTDPATQAAG